jgi:HEAT repeat protein
LSWLGRYPNRPAPGRGDCQSAAPEEALTAAVAAEEGKAAMFDEDDRLESARMLAESGSRAAGAEAYRSIAIDSSVGEDVRLEAARGLAEVDERAAVEAYRSIAADSSVGEDVRAEAARGLAEVS